MLENVFWFVASNQAHTYAEIGQQVPYQISLNARTNFFFSLGYVSINTSCSMGLFDGFWTLVFSQKFGAEIPLKTRRNLS